MQLGTRKLVDRAFTGMGLSSIALLAAALLIILLPIIIRGSGAFVFDGTVEWRRLMQEKFSRGTVAEVDAQVEAANQARRPVYEMLDEFEKEIEAKQAFFASEKKRLRGERKKLRKQKDIGESKREKTLAARKAIEDARAKLDLQRKQFDAKIAAYHDVKELVEELLGPRPGQETPVLWRDQYGKTRWDAAEKKIHEIRFEVRWVEPSDPALPSIKVEVPREEVFAGTPLEKLFPYIENNAEKMLRPQWTFYWRFLFDKSYDAHFFGGIWPEILGTIYLTIGAMIFAVPMGVISAIYLVEYAREGWMLSILRTFINTLAGVPSIVFGLFGLAFFINTMHVSPSKSVLAGSMTLALLILPMVIRASEEAIRAVPQTYKEASLSLGASKWRAVLTVILPASLPGVLTGIVISMGRAAGETAPIIFTAAVSVGKPLNLFQTLSQPTPALPWNIYNLCTEHEAVDQIRHVQYGMVLTLIALVLLLNVVAIYMRARIAKKLRA
jgi:phosphate transport system permease protein